MFLTSVVTTNRGETLTFLPFNSSPAPGQIIEMKDGRIAAQGSLDDIIAADPDMYSEFDKAVKLATESENEAEQSGYESEGTRQERLRLQKIVKKAVLAKQRMAGRVQTEDSKAPPCGERSPM